MKTTLSGKVSKWFGIVFFISVFFLGSLKAWEVAIVKVALEQKWEVTSLVYHRFGDDRYRSTNTSVEDFEQQLNWLKQQGYTFLTASEVYDYPHKEEGKFICLTVDDSYKSFYEKAYPLLKKYQAKATLYVNTESVGWSDYCTWEQLKELSEAGIEIGNHSHKHDYFVNLPEGERAIYFDSDCLLSENLFKMHLGFKPKTYAYPFGEFSEDMIKVLDKRGYVAALAQNSGVWNEIGNRYAVPRFPMSGNVSFESFTSKVKMKAFRLHKDFVGPVVINNDTVDVNLEFNYDYNIYPGLINCFVDGKRLDRISSNKGQIKVLLNQSKKRRRLVTLTTQDKNGFWCWYSQLVIISTN